MEKKATFNDLMNRRNLTLGEILAMAEANPNHNCGEHLGEFTSRMESYAIALQHGILSINEVRKLENLPKIPCSNADINFTRGDK